MDRDFGGPRAELIQERLEMVKKQYVFLVKGDVSKSSPYISINAECNHSMSTFATVYGRKGSSSSIPLKAGVLFATSSTSRFPTSLSLGSTTVSLLYTVDIAR